MMSEACEHKWWALQRLIDGAETVAVEKTMPNGETVTIKEQPMEVYGKQCEHCGVVLEFPAPVACSEIVWKAVSK